MGGVKPGQSDTKTFQGQKASGLFFPAYVKILKKLVLNMPSKIIADNILIFIVVSQKE